MFVQFVQCDNKHFDYLVCLDGEINESSSSAALTHVFHLEGFLFCFVL